MNPFTILRAFPALALLLALLWLTGCASSDALTLTNSDDGSLVTLKTIQLESNPTTGYSWAIIEYDPAVLQPQGEPEFVSEAAGQQRVGAGGWEILRFQPVATGQTQLKLGYRRPWESNVELVESFTVAVTVQ
jgi:predicted secreted protein